MDFIDFSSIFIIFKRLCGRIFMDFAWKVLQKLRFSCFSLIFIECLRFLWIFYDLNGFSVDFHGFSRVFNEFPWICIDFSSIFIIFKRLCWRIFIDLAWKVLQKLWFSRCSLIFIEFLIFLLIFYDFNGFSVDFHGFSMVLMNFNVMIFMIFIEFLRFLLIFYDFNGFSVDFHWFSMDFNDFLWIFIDFSSIFIIFKRLCGRIFIDFAWKVLQKLWFSWFSLIFIEFLIFYGFSMILMDFL